MRPGLTKRQARLKAEVLALVRNRGFDKVDEDGDTYVGSLTTPDGKRAGPRDWPGVYVIVPNDTSAEIYVSMTWGCFGGLRNHAAMPMDIVGKTASTGPRRP